MAIIVLLSTMSFTLDMHYCGNTLVDVALFKEAKTCGMKQQISDTMICAMMTKKNCCTDKQLIFEGQDKLQNSFDTITLKQQNFAVIFYYSYINLFEEIENHITPFIEYPPPFLIKDIHLLNETFLI